MYKFNFWTMVIFLYHNVVSVRCNEDNHSLLNVQGDTLYSTYEKQITNDFGC